MKLGDLFAAESRVLTHTGGCHNCVRRKQTYVPPIIVKGAQVIVVYSSATDEEFKGGESNGLQKLRSVLDKYSIRPYSLTYCVHCAGTDPDEKIISACMNQFVQEEVRGVPYVVLVGNMPAKAFFPGMGANKLRGNVIWHPDYPGQRFYTISDPNHILQNPHLEGMFDLQVERLSRILQETEPKFTVVHGTSQEAWDYLEWILAQKIVSLDIETNKLESWAPDAKMRSLALAATEDKAYFVHESEPQFIGVMDRLQTFLENPRSRVVGQNIGFDLEWLERHENFWVQAEVVIDTAFLYYQLRSYQQPGLKELSSKEADGYRYLVYEPHKEKDLWLLGQYNCEDVVEPLKLLRRAIKELPALTVDLCMRVGGPSNLALRRMTAAGIYFNVNLQKEIEEELEKEKAEIIAEWKEFDPRFNPGIHLSDAGLELYFFTLCGLPVLTRTPTTKKPQVNKANLKEWERQGFRVATLFLRYSANEKKQSTYVSGYDKHVHRDGRLHPDFINTQTDSGRPSAKDPNSQNVVRIARIRSTYGVPDEDWVYVESDYSQAELRIAVSLANDQAGIKAYLDGQDLHAKTAESFAGPGYTKAHRTDAKPVNFALIYGGSAEGLQAYARDVYGVIMTLEEAREWVKIFFGTYKGLPPWHQATNAELLVNKGHAITCVGHRFFYKEWNSTDRGERDHAFRAHINSKCQGTATYMLLYNIILTQRELIARKIPHRALIINEVHDSMHAQVRKDALPEYIQIVEKAKNEVARWASPWLKVPLVMEHDAGPDWGTAKGLPF